MIPMPEPLVIDVVSESSAHSFSSARNGWKRRSGLRPDIPVEVRSRPYFLNDWVPHKGVGRDKYLTTNSARPSAKVDRGTRRAGRQGRRARATRVEKIAPQPDRPDVTG